MKRQKKTLVILLCLLVVLAAVCTVVVIANKNKEPEPESETTLIEIKKTDTSEILAFTLINGESKYTFERTEDSWMRTDDKYFPVKESFIDSALAEFAQVSAIKQIETDEALSTYGFDADKVKQVYFTDASGVRLTVNIGDYNSYNGYYYATFDDNPQLFMIDYALVALTEKTEKDMIALDSMPSDMLSADFTSFEINGKSYDAESEQAEGLWSDLKSLSCSDYVDYHMTEEEREGYTLKEAKLVYATSVTTDADYSSSAVTSTVSHDLILYLTVKDGKLLFTLEDSDILYSMDAGDIDTLCGVLE